jgi:PAS domain-containing protein
VVPAIRLCTIHSTERKGRVGESSLIFQDFSTKNVVTYNRPHVREIIPKERSPVLIRRRKVFSGCAAAILAAPLAAGPRSAVADTIRISGIGGAAETIRLLGEAFRKVRPDVRFALLPSIGSEGAVKAVVAGDLDIGLCARPLTGKERAQVTLDSIGDGVISTDSEDRVLLVNRVAENMTGWPQAEATGRPVGEVFRRQGDVLVGRDGSRRLIEAGTSPILDESGRPLGAVLVFRDVTDKARIEGELLKVQKLESLGILISSIGNVCRQSFGIEPEIKEKIRLPSA